MGRNAQPGWREKVPQEPHPLSDVSLMGQQSGRPMPNKSKEGTVPSRERAGMVELAALFDFGNDIAPFDTPVFSKRLGELIVQATRSSRKRSKRSKPPKCS